MNILLVDDEHFRLESLQRGLKIIGHKVFAASNATEAVGHLRSCVAPIDVIITDFTTSFAANSEMIQAIGERYCRIPILMMTNSRKACHESHPLWSWCAGIIEKPFELDQLVRLIESVDESAPIAR